MTVCLRLVGISGRFASRRSRAQNINLLILSAFVTSREKLRERVHHLRLKNILTRRRKVAKEGLESWNFCRIQTLSGSAPIL